MNTNPKIVLAVLALAVSVGAAPVARADLIGSYTFDAGTGTVVTDTSGRGNHGILVNPRADTFTTGHTGGGLYLPGIPGEGVATYVDLGDPADFKLSTAFSFAAWVYSTGPDTDAPVLAKEGMDLRAYWFGVFFNGFGTLLTTEGTCCWDFDRRSLPVPAWNRWNHLASTWDGTTVKQYLNGVLVDEQPFAGPISDTPAPLTIGINSDVWSTAFTGTVDDVQVYSHALSPAEVSELALNAVSGCVNLRGTPLADAKVMLKQDLAVKQTTVTDAHGCYSFKTVGSGQPFKLEIVGPVVP